MSDPLQPYFVRDDVSVLAEQKCQDNLRIISQEHFFPLEEKNWKRIFTGYSRRELKVGSLGIIIWGQLYNIKRAGLSYLERSPLRDSL